MNAPANPATSRLPVIARNTTIPRRGPSPSSTAISATTIPFASPLMSPTRISFPTTRVKSLGSIRPSASRRTVTARAWVPALPPIPAMIGIHTARATARCTVPWKK